MINKAIQLKQELDKLRPILPEMEQRIMQKFRLDWNYHSNNLEGNSLTFGEIKALIFHNITANGKPLKDHAEVIGHDEAIKWILEIVKKDRPLNEQFIRELHVLILKNPYEVKAITPDGNPTTKMINIGVYKRMPNHVKTKTGEMFYFATPEETPAKMAELIQWFREESDVENINPIILAAQFHYRFIRIHPFDDGNGRTARILMNFVLLQFNYPPVIIKTEDKENYFAALRQADVGIFEPFAEYIATNLVHSLEIMIKGAKGESIDEPDDIDKEIALLKASLSEEQKLKKEKSEESIIKVIENTARPLLKILQEKCISLNDLFFNSKINIRSAVTSPEDENKINILGQYSDIREVGDADLILDYMDYTYEWFGLKILDEPKDFNTWVVFRFYNHYYTIEGKTSHHVTGYYGIPLSKNKIQKLITAVIRDVIEEIKKPQEEEDFPF
jgi:Fic family protein